MPDIETAPVDETTSPEPEAAVGAVVEEQPNPIRRILDEEPEVSATKVLIDSAMGETKTEETASKEEPAKKVEPEAKDEPGPKSESVAEDEFDDEILDIARSYGVSEERARSFGSVKGLETHLVLKLEEKKAAEEAAAKAEEAKKEPPKPWLEPDEELDEKLAGKLEAAFTRMAGENEAARKSYEERLDRTEKRAIAAEAAMFAVQYDGMVKEHLGEYADILGDKGVHSYAPGSPEGKAHKAIMVEMDTIMAGHNGKGRRPPNSKELITRAAKIALGDRNAEKARVDLKQEVDDRQNDFLHKPSKGKAEPEPSKDKAARRLDGLLDRLSGRR